jgi:predicted nucleic acid-binding Zn ribbon protein
LPAGSRPPRGGRPRGARGGRAERSDEVQPLGSVLDSMATDRPLASGLTLGRLGRRWEDVVGERLARECGPAALEGGLLLVRASSAAWAAQVKFLASEVRDRANQVLGFPAIQAVNVAVQQAPGDR